HLHGEGRHGGGGLLAPPPRVALGQDRPEGPLRRHRFRRPATGGLAALRPLARGPARAGARARVLLRAERELLQALPVRLLRADAHRPRVGPPPVPLPPPRRGPGPPPRDSDAARAEIGRANV